MPPKLNSKDKCDAEMKRLSKLPENKVCCDCPEKMPSYVNLTHRSFVCTMCSGIHRELQSKVKGVSMSTFSPEDVADMTAGGNAACNAMYLSRYSGDVPLPSGSDVVKLREFIRMKYVDKRWAQLGGAHSGVSVAEQSSSNRAFNINIGSAPVQTSSAFSSKISSPPPAGLDLLDMAPVSQSSAFGGFGAATPAPPHGVFDAFSAPAPTPGAFDGGTFGAPSQSHDAFSGFSAPATREESKPEPVQQPAPAAPLKDFSVFDDLAPPTPVIAHPSGNPFQQPPANPFLQQQQPGFGYPPAPQQHYPQQGVPPHMGGYPMQYPPQQAYPAQQNPFGHPQHAPQPFLQAPQQQFAPPAPQQQHFAPQQQQQFAPPAPQQQFVPPAAPAVPDPFNDMGSMAWNGVGAPSLPVAAAPYIPPAAPPVPPAEKSESVNPFDLF